MGSPASVELTLAAELRHRLRTPLNHLIGYSEILIEDFPEYETEIRVLLTEARQMLEAVQKTTVAENPELAGRALAGLRYRAFEGIGRVRSQAEQLRASMPSPAQPDLDRIVTSTFVLADTLEALNRDQPPASPEEPSRPVRGMRLDPVTGPGRILVVDDNDLNRDMLSRQLSRHDHQVSIAADGASALEALRSERFDVLLLDLMMPGMSGFEVLQAVRNDPALSGVAVIVVSALDDIESVVHCIESGAEDYLFKPVNPTLLRARIKSTLDKMRADEAVRRKQRYESIGLLAAGVAHDFNNLLTGIIGHAQLLEQVLSSREDREMAATIIQAGERAAELTKQLLAYSGKAVAQMKPVDIAALLRESEGLMRASTPKKIHLDLILTQVPPPVKADPNQIRQALLNLILNASEAIGGECNGRIVIETGVDRMDGADFDVMGDQRASGDYGWFEVRDSGCGMDAGTVAKIFEPFYSTKFLGRGLGLAAVAGIVRSHRGLLKVKSVPGRGSAFRVYFPVMQEAAAPIAKAETGGCVLIVDDEPIVRQIVKVALERTGRTVLSAGSGEAAIETMRKSGDLVSLVLLDWKMPGMDGGETLGRLREIAPDVKVIVSSGFEQREAEERFQGSGISGFLQKPYKMSELAALVECCLGLRARSA